MGIWESLQTSGSEFWYFGNFGSLVVNFELLGVDFEPLVFDFGHLVVDVGHLGVILHLWESILALGQI